MKNLAAKSRAKLQDSSRGHRGLAIIDLPSAERDPERALRASVAAVERSPITRALLDTADAILLILNAKRQILASNLERRLPRSGPLELAGLRPGDALGCTTALESTGGCGTSEACRTCGVLRATLFAACGDGPIETECVLTLREGEATEAHEFHVRATPVTIDRERYSVLSLRDMSAEKRRDALEQVFFHDVLNTLPGLLAWAERLRRRPDGDPRKAAERIAALSAQLARDVKDQRALLLAEQGVLMPLTETIAVAKILDDLQIIFSSHEVARDRALAVERLAPGLEIVTDPSILLRILINMTKNALEATPPAGAVRVWCEWKADRGSCAFHVWNREWIPRHVAARVFQRSFTTRSGSGRGLGTYSMKLLGERYLKGDVSFRSSADEGTTFTFTLPSIDGRRRAWPAGDEAPPSCA